MAIGKKNQVDGKLYIISLTSKIVDPETQKETVISPAKFLVKEKVNNKWVAKPNLETQVSGDLAKISFEKGEYQGSTYDIIKLLLVDNEEKESYLLDLRLNMITRSFFNALINLKAFDKLSFSCYEAASKKNAEKKYSNISIWRDGEWVKGKYPMDQLPKPEEIKNRAGIVQKLDFSELDSFFIKELTKLASSVSEFNKANRVNKPSSSVSKPSEKPKSRQSNTESDVDSTVDSLTDDVPI